MAGMIEDRINNRGRVYDPSRAIGRWETDGGAPQGGRRVRRSSTGSGSVDKRAAAFTAERANMVNGQVITVGITDRRLIATLLAVPRERFVPTSMVALAHSDSDLLVKEATPTSPARYLMAVGSFARLVQEAAIGSADTVLDVGCATGYSAAVLAHLAKSIIALETDERLAALATETLIDLGLDNVDVVTGPLEEGWPDAAHYDVILIGGSIETVPVHLTEQLAVGGRLVAVIGRSNAALGTVYTKSAYAIGARRAYYAALRPLPGFTKPKAFVF